MINSSEVFIFFHSPVFWEFPLTYYQETATALSKYCSVLYYAEDEPPFGYRDFASPKRLRFLLKTFISYFCACTIYVPFNILPGNRHTIIALINKLFSQKILRLLLYKKSFKRTSYHFITHANMVGSLKYLRIGHLLYECMDYPCDMTDPKKNTLVYQNHIKALSLADLTFVHNRAIEKICSRHSNHIVRIPVGYSLQKYIFNCDSDLPENIKRLTKPLVCFVGYTFVRLDMALLFKVVRQNPDLSFIFVGPERTEYIAYSNTNKMVIDRFYKQWGKFKTLPNVHYTGELSVSSIRAIIKASDVCMIPYDISQKPALYANSIKAYEYLALGKHVVSTKILPLLELHPYIFFADNEKDFSKKLNSYVLHPQTPDRSKRIRIAKSQDIQNKVRRIIKILLQQT